MSEDDTPREEDDGIDRELGSSDAPETSQEIDEDDSFGAQPDAGDEDESEQPRTSEGGPIPESGRQYPVASEQPISISSPAPPSEAPHDPEGRSLLVFMNEVAGGRKLLAAVRERAAAASYIAVVAPQNHPAIGALIDNDEVRDAARSRVDVTMAVLAEFGFDSVGDVMDPDPSLALDDAVRAFEPGELLISAMNGSRFGLMRKDLVEWARARFEPETAVTHIPVRVQDDSIRWDVNHTLVVATQTVATPDLVERLKDRARERRHRFTFICPRSESISRERVCRDLAATMAELYRADIDATGQPSSPDAFAAVQNALEHYRIDDVLISTLAGEQSRWLEEDLVGRAREITDKPVEHVEAGRSASSVAAAVAAGPDGDGAGAESEAGARS